MFPAAKIRPSRLQTDHQAEGITHSCALDLLIRDNLGIRQEPITACRKGEQT
jgi:hypothetical protein